MEAQPFWAPWALYLKWAVFRKIVFHYRPHLDEILGAFMLQYLSTGKVRWAKEVQYGFWAAGSATPDGNSVRHHMAKGTIVLGCGGPGPFNEHASLTTERVVKQEAEEGEEKGESCASMTKTYLDVEENPRLLQLLHYAVGNDLNGEKAKKSLDATFSLARIIVDLHKINRSDSFTKLDCEGQHRVVRIGVNMCRALCNPSATISMVDGRSLLGSVMAYWLMRNHVDKFNKGPENRPAYAHETSFATNLIKEADSDKQLLLDWVYDGQISLENGIDVASKVVEFLGVLDVPAFQPLFNYLLKKVDEPYTFTLVIEAMYAMIGDNYTMGDFVSDICEVLDSKAFAQDEYKEALEIIRCHAKTTMVDGVSKKFKLAVIDGKGNKSIGGNEALAQAARSKQTRAQAVITRNTEGLVSITLDKGAWKDEGAVVRAEIIAAIRQAELELKGLPVPSLDILRREGPVADVPHWFMFKGGVFNGALTNPGETPTELSLETIVRIVSEVLKRF